MTNHHKHILFNMFGLAVLGMHMQEVISYVLHYEAHFRGIMERELWLAGGFWI